MDAATFTKVSQQKLTELENWLQNNNAELDTDTPQDGMLVVTRDDGREIIINAHHVAKEIWLAAPSGAFHFRLADGGVWRDTRDGMDLLQRLQLAIAT